MEKITTMRIEGDRWVQYLVQGENIIGYYIEGFIVIEKNDFQKLIKEEAVRRDLLSHLAKYLTPANAENWFIQTYEQKQGLELPGTTYTYKVRYVVQNMQQRKIQH